jgi:hypothetical protein
MANHITISRRPGALYLLEEEPKVWHYRGFYENILKDGNSFDSFLLELNLRKDTARKAEGCGLE